MEPSERLAVIEHRLSTVEANYKTIDQKLDQIVSLRDRGMGAFWLASALVDIGGLSLITAILKWGKNLWLS